MSAILDFLVHLIRSLLEFAISTPTETGRTVAGNVKSLPPSAPATIVDRARASGLLLLLVFVACGCGTTHVVVATGFPVDDASEGWPRIAQDEVKVMLKDGTIGTIAPAGGYRVIHDADLRGLLKMAKANG